VRNRGNQADYVLGTAEGWDAFGVVRWHGVEEISQPYRYDITLTRPVADGPVDLDKLLDAGATLRIASQRRWRTVHGVLAEAEEIDRTAQIFLYRLLLVPHFWRARYRRRCRNFVNRTLREIVSAVLENRSPAHPEGKGGLIRFTSAPAPDQHPVFASFTPPIGSYRWDLKDPARVDDRTRRPYVAQYNESDFDFVARLLEDEGLSYDFEHARDEAVFAITDKPGVSPMFDEDTTFELRRLSKTGRGDEQEVVRSFRDPRRLQSRAVTVRDWDYNRSGRPLQATVDEAPDDADLGNHFEFPVGEEAVKDRPGMHAAEIRMQRHDVERALREGAGTLRTMEPGRRFTLHDADGLRADAKLLAVRVETFATELTPEQTILDEEPFGFAGAVGPLTPGLDCRFLALAEGVAFRPAMSTPRPRIHGVQAAVITAEEFQAEDRPAINADSLGRVRVRFPWDQRPDGNDRTPTSEWIRVSQFWAGTSYGALYTPRVGHEVLVAYMQGDPDRPVIVGRVYNPQHPPPYDASKDPTRSTVKSQSAEEKKEVDGFNEIRFEDRARKEEIYLHAQRDLNEVVLASHSTSVGGDQSNSVGGNQTNSVKGHREHKIDDYEKVTVGADRTTTLLANEYRTVTGFRATQIGAEDVLLVEANRFVTVSGAYGVKVGQDITSQSDGIHAFRSSNTYFYPTGDFQVNSTTAGFNQSTSFYVKAAGCTLEMSAGVLSLDNGAGAAIRLIGGNIFINVGGALVTLVGGPTINVTGGEISVTAGGDIDAAAPNIHLNG
jgi:type VI secretion system secreted protein VgrG